MKLSGKLNTLNLFQRSSGLASFPSLNVSGLSSTSTLAVASSAVRVLAGH